MKNEQEIWKDVKNFEGFYQVSNLGRVKSLERLVRHKPGQHRLVKERILSPCQDNCGYLHVRLANDGVYKLFKVHRLVAMHFLESYSEDLTVNHINHDRTDNRAENLEMLTLKENILDKDFNRKIYCKELNQYICQPKRFFKRLNIKYNRYRFLQAIENNTIYYGYHFEYSYTKDLK